MLLLRCLCSLTLLLLTSGSMFHGSNNNNNQVCDWDICHDGLDKSKSRRKEDENSKCKYFDITKFGPDSKSIFYGEANGRFGNQLLGYALLHHFRDVVGVDSYINREMKDYLEKVFTPDSLSMPLMEETYCNPEDIPWEYYYGHIRDLLKDPKYHRGKFLLLYPPINGDLNKGYRPEDHQSKEQDEMQRAYVKHIRTKFKWRPSVYTKIQKTFKEVAKKMGKKTKEMTYVGVHNRRTDSIEFIRRGWHQEELDADYFLDAMDYFREEYDEDGEGTVAFLYVSDDMEWGRREIGSGNSDDVFFVGEGNEDDDSIAFDLGILAFSNHTIISRGTYSMWGSILCKGEYYTEYGPFVRSVTTEEDGD